MSKKQKSAENKEDFLAEEATEAKETSAQYTLDIPDDEIWTYKIEGLQPTHINKPFKNAVRNKTIVVIAIVVSVFLSIFFSVRVVHSETYKYKELDDGTYELISFSNPGKIKDITIDYVVDSKTGEKDLTKPITVIHEYAFNCDEVLNSITLGKDVKSIDGKSIYSCWWVETVFVDSENPYYCDIEGVVYTKDMTQVVFYPNDHDKYLRLLNGYAEEDENGNRRSLLVDDNGKEMEELWGTTEKYDEAFFDEYNRLVRTYVVPSTVTKIGELAFAYSNIWDIYLPQGLEYIGNMALFKNNVIRYIHSYTSEKPITDVSAKAISEMSTVYDSLPEGLEYIGSDSFSYFRGVDYMYIPSSVKHIGHHAFWDDCYKDDGGFKGVSEMNIALEKDVFEQAVETGDQWLPIIDTGLVRKKIVVNYGVERR